MFDLLYGKVTNEICEGLVEPQVIPPLHGDKVAEPHVCQLMHNDVGEHLNAGGGRSALLKIIFI